MRSMVGHSISLMRVNPSFPRCWEIVKIDPATSSRSTAVEWPSSFGDDGGAASIRRRRWPVANDPGVEFQIGRGGHRVHQLGQTEAAQASRSPRRSSSSRSVIWSMTTRRSVSASIRKRRRPLAQNMVSQLRARSAASWSSSTPPAPARRPPGSRAPSGRRRCQRSRSCRAIRTSSQVGFFQFGLRSSAAGWYVTTSGMPLYVCTFPRSSPRLFRTPSSASPAVPPIATITFGAMRSSWRWR